MKMAAAINSCKVPGFRIQTKTSIASSSLQIQLVIGKKQAQFSRAARISCSSEDDREELKESEHLSFSKKSQQVDTSIDLKLPRRNLLVTFTCDACGARSQRLINRLAYEHGLFYVQCIGCSQYHKLVDNLGLVVEYKLQDEIEFDANKDHS